MFCSSRRFNHLSLSLRNCFVPQIGRRIGGVLPRCLENNSAAVIEKTKTCPLILFAPQTKPCDKTTSGSGSAERVCSANAAAGEFGTAPKSEPAEHGCSAQAAAARDARACVRGMELRNGFVPQTRCQQQSSAARCSQDSLRNNHVPQRSRNVRVPLRSKSFEKAKTACGTDAFRKPYDINLISAPECSCVPQARFQQQSSEVEGGRCSQDSLRNNRVPQRFPSGTVAFRCVQKALPKRKQLAERIRSANLINLRGAAECSCGTPPFRRQVSSSSLLRWQGRGVPRIPCGTSAFRSVFLAERLRSAAFKKL